MILAMLVVILSFQTPFCTLIAIKLGESMNRFIVDETPEAIAQALCDKHIVKMPLEEAQMLCTAVREHSEQGDELELYKSAHKNHPATIWVRETRSNYEYGLQLFKAMLNEYTHRYGKIHASSRLIKPLEWAAKFIPDGGLTKHPVCFKYLSDVVKQHPYEQWPIDAYRACYQIDKPWAAWNKNRAAPSWW